MKPRRTIPAPVRWWDMSAALRLLVLMVIAVSRLTITGWTFHLQIVYVIAILGTIYGLALGQSRFSPFVAAVMATLTGLFVIPWQIGLTTGPGILWLERILSIVGRLTTILTQLSRQEPVPDYLLFLVLMSILFWVLSVQAAYNLARYAHSWRSALPVGLAILIMHTYDPNNRYGLLILGAYSVLTLLLVAHVTYLRRRRQWEHSRVQAPPEAGIELSQAALVAALLLVLIAWSAPPIAMPVPPLQQTWQKVSQPWRVIRNRMSNMFVSLRATLGVVTDYYDQNMELGLGNTFGDNVVMTVEAPGDPPPGVRYYWRAWVYDRYNDGGWASTAPDTRSVTPDNFDLPFPELGGRWGATFIFNSSVSITTLYAPSQAVWASRPVRAALTVNDDGTVDLAALHAQAPLFAGETYRVQSLLSSATIAQLREAGDDYPAWVTGRYLQLPAEVTQRTRDLAQSLAAGHDNPYDIAQTVTNYLRDNIEYTRTIDPPPLGQEPLDWLLFDYKKGFCNYYASAEIVLLRSLGIPARIAVGYARGEIKVTDETALEQQFGERPQTLTYEVRQADAHAWPEVYFPGYGWVEFEPTAGQAPLFRPTGLDLPDPASPPAQGPDRTTPDDPTDLLRNEEDPGSTASTTSALNVRLLVVSGSLIPALILFYVVWRMRPQDKPIPVLVETGLRRVGVQPPAALQRWAIRASWTAVERAYQEINNALGRLGARPAPADTPAERAVALENLLPANGASIQSLVREYHATAFSGRGGSILIAHEAANEIRQASWRGAVRRFFNRGPQM